MNIAYRVVTGLALIAALGACADMQGAPASGATSGAAEEAMVSVPGVETGTVIGPAPETTLTD